MTEVLCWDFRGSYLVAAYGTVFARVHRPVAISNQAFADAVAEWRRCIAVQDEIDDRP